MKRLKIYDLRFTTIILPLLFLINHQSLIINQVAFAEESTSSSKIQTATKSATLLDKINSIKAEVASKAANLKLEINNKIENKAIVGVVKKIGGKDITLSTRNGEKVVAVNEYTLYESRARKPGLDDMDPDDYVVALGDMDDKNNLVAKKIVWLTKPVQNSIRVFFWGQVQSVNGAAITIKSKDDKKTTVITKFGTGFAMGSEETTLAEVKINKFISGVGIANPQGELDAQFVYIIPTGGIIKSATPSASILKK